jgi:hypothetical protein
MSGGLRCPPGFQWAAVARTAGDPALALPSSANNNTTVPWLHFATSDTATFATGTGAIAINNQVGDTHLRFRKSGLYYVIAKATWESGNYDHRQQFGLSVAQFGGTTTSSTLGADAPGIGTWTLGFEQTGLTGVFNYPGSTVPGFVFTDVQCWDAVSRNVNTVYMFATYFGPSGAANLVYGSAF